jgi:hypothetical protein
MNDTKKVISKADQDKKRLENQEKFILWLQKMNNVHQANPTRVQRALDTIS